VKTNAQKTGTRAKSVETQQKLAPPLAAGHHPEDLIFETKKFINQLGTVQEEKFTILCSSLSMTEKGKDWLFDYVYNCDEPLCFDEYLAKYGIEYSECVLTPSVA
jgi:hypothetical protein